MACGVRNQNVLQGPPIETTLQYVARQKQYSHIQLIHANALLDQDLVIQFCCDCDEGVKHGICVCTLLLGLNLNHFMFPQRFVPAQGLLENQGALNEPPVAILNVNVQHVNNMNHNQVPPPLFIGPQNIAPHQIDGQQSAPVPIAVNLNA